MSKNRLIGGTFLVAGTTIGAGMLALPITVYGLGFTWGIILLAVMWLFMYYAATVTADLSLHHGKGLTIASLARQHLGPKGEIVASSSLLFLFYALLTAYTVGGSSILGSILRNSFGIDLPAPACMVIFTLVFGTIVTTTMTGMDYLNRLLFILKVGAFGGMTLWLLPKVSPDLLATSETQGTFQAWHLAIPIVFTSFGFHGSIPSLMNYMNMNRGHLKIAFLVGSLIPLLVYVLWLAITIGTISPDIFSAIIAKGGDLGSLVTALNDASGSQGISVFTDIFAGIGVITSYMGVGIGVVDFYRERLKASPIQKPVSGLLTFSVPLLFGILYPQGFIAALGYAAIALSMLAVILPAMIALKLRAHSNPIKLYLLLATGIGIVALEVLHIAKVL